MSLDLFVLNRLAAATLRNCIISVLLPIYLLCPTSQLPAWYQFPSVQKPSGKSLQWAQEMAVTPWEQCATEAPHLFAASACTLVAAEQTSALLWGTSLYNS